MRLSLAPALAALAIACAPAPSAAADPLLDGSACAGADVAHLGFAADEAAVRCLVNTARARARVALVHRVAGLMALARERLDLLIACNEFSHTPCGRPLDVWHDRRYRRATGISENLQWLAIDAPPRAIVSNWLGSPPHRASIIDRDWRDVGFAVAHGVPFLGRSNMTVCVLLFGRRVTRARKSARSPRA